MRWNRQAFIVVIGAAMVLVFGTVIMTVFGLISASGSTYSAYSTYRSDPMGMMAVYNALDRIDGYEVERFIRDFEALPDGADTTLIIAGAALSPDPAPVLDAVEAFATAGGRIVFAFYPLHENSSLRDLDDFMEKRDAPKPDESETAGHEDTGAKDMRSNQEGTAKSSGTTAPEEEPKDEAGASPKQREAKEESSDRNGPDSKAELDFGPRMEDLSERWQFNYGFDKPTARPVYTLLNTALPLEQEFSGHSGLYFRPVNEGAWKIIYGVKTTKGEAERVMMMERAIGKGSVVLCSDAYFLSNEGLHAHYDPQLLSWLFGQKKRVIFSEVHLGTQQQDRIMTLVRHYRLHGVVFGLLLLGALFVWHHGATLIPRRENVSEKRPSTTIERSHQDGLDNLLARFIPRNQLLDICTREWSQQFHNDPRGPVIQQLAAGCRERMRGAGADAELVAAFNEMAREIHHK